jgi:hypothetical protein
MPQRRHQVRTRRNDRRSEDGRSARSGGNIGRRGSEGMGGVDRPSYEYVFTSVLETMKETEIVSDCEMTMDGTR